MKIFKSRGFWAVALVIFFALLAGRHLLTSGYFLMHDDLQMMRQLEMEKCFLDAQIPCRWVPDMGFGYGFPLFNFYPPLPYLIGEIFRAVGFSFVTTAKLTFLLSMVVSGITMYVLAKEFFGKLGGVVSAVFYIWAPYHAVDVFVRGAMNESWALAWFPLIFWTSYRLIKEKENLGKWIIGLTLSWFMLLTSHNLMVLMFTPFFGLWVLIHMTREKSLGKLPRLIISGLWALGLSSFFTLPAILENKLTWIRSQLSGYFEYSAHFVNVKQLLFSQFWGYGGSAWGIENDGMSFQIGQFYWILSLLILFVLLYRFIKTKKADKITLVVSLMLAFGWFSAFMTHTRATFIYKLLPVLQYVQFPWRFLTIVIFAFSFIAGYLMILTTKKNLRFLLAAFLIGFVILLNWHYFLPAGGEMGPLEDSQKFSGAAWELQQGGGVLDYLPITVDIPPTKARESAVEIMEGEGKLENIETGTKWVSVAADIKETGAKIRINIFDFPHWKVFVDGLAVEKYIPDEETLGRIWIDVPSGTHTVYASFTNTKVRTFANILTVLSFAILVGYAARVKFKKG